MTWEPFVYLLLGALISLCACVLGAIVWGPGAIQRLEARMKNVENRTEDVDDRITSEVKKRANVASRESRREARTDADVVAEATQSLTETDSGPTGAAGRVRTTGVFPVTAKRR